MKKVILLFFCFVSTCVFCFCEKIYKEMPDGNSQWVELTSEYHYDEKGRVTYFLDRDGVETWNQFDSKGNLIYSKNSNGVESWYEYDKKGNNIHFENSEGYQRWSDFDSNNNEIYWSDTENYWCEQEYDSKGHMIHILDSNDFEGWVEYDKFGNETSSKNNRGYYKVIEYDKKGKIVSEKSYDFDTLTDQHEYDKNGNLIHSVFTSAEFWYEYDKDGYRTREIIEDFMMGTSKTRTLSYDKKIKNLDKVEYESEWYNFRWWNWDYPECLIGISDTNGFSFSLEYDKYGHITKYEDSSGFINIYEYEYYKDGNVKTVTEYEL